MQFVMHLLFFPARTIDTEHVHRLKPKESQWKGGTQTEDAHVKGQEIFYGNIMPHRKINMQLRGNFVRVMGNSNPGAHYHNYLKKIEECSML